MQFSTVAKTITFSFNVRNNKTFYLCKNIRNMIDRKVFNEQYKFFDKEFIVEIIDMFLNDYKDRFILLHNDVETLNFQSLKFNAHSLKGVITNFWDPVTTELSHRLNDMARNEIQSGLKKSLDELEAKTEILIEELKAMKREFTS